jgi:hypothetical protein
MGRLGKAKYRMNASAKHRRMRPSDLQPLQRVYTIFGSGARRLLLSPDLLSNTEILVRFDPRRNSEVYSSSSPPSPVSFGLCNHPLQKTFGGKDCCQQKE